MIHTKPRTAPAAMQAMAANRIAEQREKERAEWMEMARTFAQRIVQLTELVVDLQERVEQLEGRKGDAVTVNPTPWEKAGRGPR